MTTTNESRGFFAYCQANVRGHETRGLEVSKLADTTKYIVVIPTNTMTYFKTIKGAKLVDGFKSVEKGEVADAYSKFTRHSGHMPLRNYFNGKGDCVIATASGKLLKKDKALLADAGATVCMSADKYKSIIEAYKSDKQLKELSGARYKTQDHKRMALSIRRIEVFFKAMNDTLVFNMPKAKEAVAKVKAAKEKLTKKAA